MTWTNSSRMNARDFANEELSGLMNSLQQQCPTADELARFQAGESLQHSADDVAKHLDRCPGCQSRVATSEQRHASFLATAGPEFSYCDERAFLNLRTKLRGFDASPSGHPASTRLHDFAKTLTAPNVSGNQQGSDSTWMTRHLRTLLSPGAQPNHLGRMAHYEVIDVLGHGGMGLVVKARDTQLDRPVAIKLITAGLAENEEARTRFRREALALGTVRHEHVVALHAAGDFRGQPYFVMEYVDGESLQQFIRREGRIAPATVALIGQQIAAGLEAVHRAGLIHRDLKPANILRDRHTGRIYIADFGLVQATGEDGSMGATCISGTPDYMSPEQAQTTMIDHRADLFALGGVLYTLCSGRPPFQAATPRRTLRKVCDTPHPPLRNVVDGMPADLERIINCLLEKDANARFPSATDVAIALRDGAAVRA